MAIWLMNYYDEVLFVCIVVIALDNPFNLQLLTSGWLINRSKTESNKRTNEKQLNMCCVANKPYYLTSILSIAIAHFLEGDERKVT